MEVNGSENIPTKIITKEQKCTFHKKELKEDDFSLVPSPKKTSSKYFEH